MLNIKQKNVRNVTFYTVGNKSILYFVRKFWSALALISEKKRFLTWTVDTNLPTENNLNVAFRLNISEKF